MYIPHMYLVLAKARSGCLILWNWNHRELLPAMWVLVMYVLGTEPGSSYKSNQCSYLLNPAHSLTCTWLSFVLVLPARTYIVVYISQRHHKAC